MASNATLTPALSQRERENVSRRGGRWRARSRGVCPGPPWARRTRGSAVVRRRPLRRCCGSARAAARGSPDRRTWPAGSAPLPQTRCPPGRIRAARTAARSRARSHPGQARQTTDFEVDRRVGRKRLCRWLTRWFGGRTTLEFGQQLLDSQSERLQLLLLDPQHSGAPVVAFDHDAEGAVTRLADRLGLQPGGRAEDVLGVKHHPG